jgi:predicted nucleic acid-binding protein
MTARYLFDANIVAELARPRPDASVVKFASTISDVMVSSILFYELTFGLEAEPAEQKTRLTIFVQ